LDERSTGLTDHVDFPVRQFSKSLSSTGSQNISFPGLLETALLISAARQKGVNRGEITRVF
jgi:hypothetical protein